jgi:uncharacterized protein YndB with AHSA1/START domain
MEPIKEVHFERVYDAPLSTVWHAWTDAETLKKWWGPDNVSIPECSVDLTVGGAFYIVMEAGEAMGEYKGTKWPMQATFTVIEPEARLTYTADAWTEGAKEKTTINQTTDIQFAEEDGKTKVTVTAAIYSAGPGASMAVEGIKYGFTQQLEKLDLFLSKN